MGVLYLICLFQFWRFERRVECGLFLLTLNYMEYIGKLLLKYVNALLYATSYNDVISDVTVVFVVSVLLVLNVVKAEST